MEEMYDKVIEEWRMNKGLGTIMVAKPFSGLDVINRVIERFYRKNAYTRMIIIAGSWTDRKELISSFETLPVDIKTSVDNKFCRVLTYDYILDHPTYNGNDSIIILYNIKNFSRQFDMYVRTHRFKLAVLNSLIENYVERMDLYNLCPQIKGLGIDEARLSRENTPIEEIQVPITFSTGDDIKLLEKYNDFVSSSMAIFENFETIDKARNGDKTTNMSAIEFCTVLAQNNGWSFNLDMSIPYNQALDEMYNPNSLMTRAHETYNFIRDRNTLLSANGDKLQKVVEIIKQQQGTKVLIINKTWQFADKVADALHDEGFECKSFHNNHESIPAVDEFGNPILYKSGKQKGLQKMMGVTSIQKRTLKMFEQGKIDIISTNNAPNKLLKGKFDIVIITSPQSGTIQDYIYRCDGIEFQSPLRLYTLYMEGTTEEHKIDDKPRNKNHKIIKQERKYNVGENKCDFIVEV